MCFIWFLCVSGLVEQLHYDGIYEKFPVHIGFYILGIALAHSRYTPYHNTLIDPHANDQDRYGGLGCITED